MEGYELGLAEIVVTAFVTIFIPWIIKVGNRVSILEGADKYGIDERKKNTRDIEDLEVRVAQHAGKISVLETSGGNLVRRIDSVEEKLDKIYDLLLEWRRTTNGHGPK